MHLKQKEQAAHLLLIAKSNEYRRSQFDLNILSHIRVGFCRNFKIL